MRGRVTLLPSYFFSHYVLLVLEYRDLCTKDTHTQTISHSCTNIHAPWSFHTTCDHLELLHHRPSCSWGCMKWLRSVNVCVWVWDGLGIGMRLRYPLCKNQHTQYVISVQYICILQGGWVFWCGVWSAELACSILLLTSTPYQGGAGENYTPHVSLTAINTIIFDIYTM